jgi:Icc-related predicted phosphoesterase
MSAYDADVLIHAGDYSGRGSIQDTLVFAKWLEEMSKKFKHIIFVPGNHDFIFETDEGLAKALLPDNVIYLNDNGVTIDGINFWGSPITPTFFNWAFMRDRGQPIKKHWMMIPETTDVLITHGPPQWILDRCANGSVGCADLADEVISRIKPKVHVFGHIHSGYGTLDFYNIKFVNASICNDNYQPVNKPIEVII